MPRLPLNLDFESAPPFVAAQTSDNWIDGTAAGSVSNATSGWWASPRATAIAVQFDSTVQHSGTYSLKVSTTNTTGRARVFSCLASGGTVTGNGTNAPYFIPVIAGQTYVFSGWVKTSNVAAGGAFLEIVEINDAFAVGTSTGSTALTGTNGFTFLSVSVTVGATTRYIAIDMQNATAGNVSDAWFDDLTLTGPGITNNGYIPVKIANRNVGPMALRHAFKQPYLPQSGTVAAANQTVNPVGIGSAEKFGTAVTSAFALKKVVHIGSQSLDVHTNTQGDTDAVVAALLAAVPNLTHIAVAPYMDYGATSGNDQFTKWATSIHNAGKKMWLRPPGFNWWLGTNSVAQYTGSDFAAKHRGDMFFWLLDNHAFFQPGDIFTPVPDEPENNSMWNSTYGTIGSGTGQTAFNGFITGAIDDVEAQLGALGVIGVDVRYVFTNPSTARDVLDGVTEGYLHAMGTDDYPESGLSIASDIGTAMDTEVTTWIKGFHSTKKKHITFGPSVYSQLSGAVQSDAINLEDQAIESELGNQLDGLTLWQFGATDNSPLSRLFDWNGAAWVARQATTIVNTIFADISPPGSASAGAIGNPAVTTSYTVSPVGIASAGVLGTPAVTTSYTVTPAGIGSAEALGAAAVGLGSSPVGAATAELLGAPSVTTTVTISPVGIATSESVGSHTIVAQNTIRPGGVRFAFVQSKQGSTGGATSLVLTMNAPVAQGDLLVVNLKFSSARTGITVTDNASIPNTYADTGAALSAAGPVLYQFYGVAKTGGATQITISWAGSISARHTVDEFSGNAQSNGAVFDAFETGSGTGTISTVPPFTPTESGSLVAGQVIWGSGGTVAAGDGYTLSQNASLQSTQYKLMSDSLEIFPESDPTPGSWGALAGIYKTAVGGIASAETLGAVSVAPSTPIVAAGIASGETLGQVSVTTSATISPVGIASGQQLGAATVTPGAVSIAPVGVPTSETLGAVSVAPSTPIVAQGIKDSEAVGNPAITTSATVSPNAVPSSEAFGPIVLTPGVVLISAVGIASGQTIGNPAMTTSATVSPTGIASGQTLGSPGVTSVVIVTAAGIASAEKLGSAVSAPGAFVLLLAGIPSASQVGSSTLSAGNLLSGAPEITSIVLGGVSTAIELAGVATAIDLDPVSLSVELQSSIVEISIDD